MKIKPKIPIFQGGTKLWYEDLIDYDPTKYEYAYDTTSLVDGDMSDDNFNPWVSNIKGYDTIHRYQPTTGHGSFGTGGEHFKYTKGVEGLNYYTNFGKALIDENGNFTDTGVAWAKAVDALLPPGSKASFFDEKGQLRKNWITQYRDAHGRGARSFNNLRDYVNYVRNDQILGARHNVFLNLGKRYFYKDKDGVEHWVDPSKISNYKVSENPVRSNWNDDHTVYWKDYELTGLTDAVDGGNPLGDKEVVITSGKKSGGIPVGEKEDPESLWGKLGQGIKNVAPDLLDALRLAGNMYNNELVYKESMKAILPNLLHSYHTYRQVTGDEATKQGYYRRAVLGEQKAARPFTSDADRQVAYMNEAKRIGDELRAQGDLADNQRIRETSAESSAHADANTERDTQVSNSNLTELIKANAAKHQLTAQKYSADWTNLEQYLMGQLYKLEKDKAEQKELEQLLALISSQENLLNDSELRKLRDIADKAYDAYANYKGKDENGEDEPEEIVSLKKELLKKAYEEAIKAYRLRTYAISKLNLQEQYRIKAGKSGIKVEKKHKDDSLKYLYKTSKDIVEHFLRMSKMTDDSRTKTLPKPIKLVSHPKKFQLGGVAPFTIYRPLGAGGETTTTNSRSTSSSGKSEKDEAAKNKLDMIKELFKAILGLGLPIDVSNVYSEIQGLLNKASAFGEELSTDDIASMYLSSMNKINNIKYSKEVFDKAKELATTNEALNEFAVTTGGRLVLLDLESGSIKFGTYQELISSKGKLNALTNDLLLNLRAYSPNMALAKGDELMLIVNNGVGMNKIAVQIKSLAANIGSSEKKIEGISQVESNKIKQGLLLLAGVAGTPDGYYKITLDAKNSSSLVKAALTYIKNMLPGNYKTILDVHSGGNSEALIASFLTSQASDTYEESISPLTGKASSKEGGGDSSKITPAVALSMGLGERENFVIADKTSDGLKVSAVNLPLLDLNHNAMAIATLQLVGSGDYAGQLLLTNATMGGVKISPEGLNNVLVSGGRIHAAELPIDKEAASHGIIKPNLNFLKNIEKADEQIKAAGITNRDNLTADLVKLINSIYNKNGLPMLYTMGSNGPVLTSDYRRFAMVNATATQEAFEEDLSFNDGVTEASDDDRKRFEALMKQATNNSKYSLNNGISIPGIGRITGTDVYKGIVYIPMSESHISALSSTGYKASPEEYNLIDALDLLAEFIRSSGYKSAGGWTQ